MLCAYAAPVFKYFPQRFPSKLKLKDANIMCSVCLVIYRK